MRLLSSDLHNYRQDHRPATRLLVYVLGGHIPDLTLDEGHIGSRLFAAAVEPAVERVAHPLLGALEQVSRLAQVRDAATDHVGPGHDTAAVAIDADDDHQDTVL